MGQPRRIYRSGNLSSYRLKDANYMGDFNLMSCSRRALAILAAAVFLIVAACSAMYAASGTSKLHVPANIIKGSALTSGRAFYSTSLPEDSLAGIRLGRPAKEILAKWGNPSRITVGTTVSEVQQPGMPPTDSGPAYIPPGGATLPSPYPMPGSSNSLMDLPGLPGLPGPSPSYGSPAQNLPGTGTQTGGTTQVLTQEEVTWTYDLQNGITLEFIITDGLVTQITVGGVGPWSLSKTRTGLQLGDTYKLVLWVCGYPEKQSYVGRFLRVSYVNKSRALFTFLDKKLVGVTIALVPKEIAL